MGNPTQDTAGTATDASDPDDFHCPNCLFLPDPITPGDGFWACQGLCIRPD